MRGLSVIFLVHMIAYCSAQTVMTADKTRVFIGDQIKTTITTDLSEGKQWRNLEEVWPDTIRGMEIVSGPEIDAKNPSSARYTWIISVFDTGWVIIPAVPVVIREGNQLDTFYTMDIPVQVMPVEPDSTGLAGIKDIVRQPFSIGYYKKYIPHLILLLLLLAGLYYWWRKTHRKEEIIEVPEPEPPPHEWAFAALDRLEEKKLWQKGEVKEHYSILTAILREYLERRYGINALEQTSDEILQQLRLQRLPHELVTDTEQLLSVADLIKFAKADPGVNLHEAAIERVRRFVKQTMLMTDPDSTVQQTMPDEAVE